MNEEPISTIEDALNGDFPKYFGMRYSLPPEVLYHYTTLQGLMGIVRSGRIWATNARYLNDMNESRQLWIFLERRFQAIAASGKRFPDVDLDTLVSLIHRHVDHDVFVASFSETRDSLSQWRAYSGGGPGICLGFAGNALNTAWIYNPSGKAHWTSKQFEKVQYLSENEAGLDSALEDLLNGARSPMFSAAKTLAGQKFSIAEDIVMMLSLFHARYKHDAFREEEEWRLSFQRHHKPMRHQQFRASRTMLIPYIEAELNKDIDEKPLVPGEFIREVIIGPSAHADLNKRAVEQFLLSMGRSEISVVLSSAPYRDW